MDENLQKVVLQPVELPQWTTKALIHIEFFGNKELFSEKTDTDYSEDLDAISHMLRNTRDRRCLLLPAGAKPTNGIYIGSHTDGIPSKYWTLLISTKLYHKKLSKRNATADRRSTNWSFAYEHKDNLPENKHRMFQQMKKDYEQQDSLRLHLYYQALLRLKINCLEVFVECKGEEMLS